jgi:hypothetical protein
MSRRHSPVDFFVRYAESEGALAELVPEGALVVLPDTLERRLQLGEEVRLTEDPEVAREDGFVLLSPGHPVLTGAAQAVLERGDVGCVQVPRNPGPPPALDVLERVAREQVHAEHGRVDSTDPPNAAALLVLRVGALITYGISIDQRVQELEEVWVEAASGELLPEDLRVRVAAAATEPGAPDGSRARTVVDHGVARAHAELGARAERRSLELARQTSARLRAQLAVVDDYYQRVITGIDERRARAPEERARLLASQAEATKGEWDRRRAEVADDLTPSYELHPFRLHLVSVPAYHVPSVVRRGARAYELALTYVPLISGFLPPRCPGCGSAEPLVAGKDRLGCRACFPPPMVPAPVVPRPVVPPPVVPAPVVPAPVVPAPVVPATVPATAAVARDAAPRSQGGSPARRGAPKRGRTTPRGTNGSHGTSRTGSRLAVSFWESVFAGSRLRRHDILPGSPLQALLRLYGTRGPALVVGLQDGELPESVQTETFPDDGTGWMLATGELITPTGQEFPFGLHWLAGGTALIAEVDAFPPSVLARLDMWPQEIRRIFRRRFAAYLLPAPAPTVALEKPAAALLRHASRRYGLAFAARCLAAWWYVTEVGETTSSRRVALVPDLPMAAAVEWVVAKRAGLRVTTNAVAEQFGCPVEEVRGATRRVQGAVRDAPEARW